MKKSVLFIVIICMIFSFCLANAANDCFEITKEERSILQLEENENTIRFFNGGFMHGFANRETVDNLMSEKYVLEEEIVVYDEYNDANIRTFRIKDGVGHIVNSSKKIGSFFINFTNAKTMSQIERKYDCKIENIICLSGEASHDGLYVCYISEKGTYILYSDYSESKDVYLFEINEFYEIASEYQRIRKENLTDEEGNVRKSS